MILYASYGQIIMKVCTGEAHIPLAWADTKVPESVLRQYAQVCQQKGQSLPSGATDVQKAHQCRYVLCRGEQKAGMGLNWVGEGRMRQGMGDQTQDWVGLTLTRTPSKFPSRPD